MNTFSFLNPPSLSLEIRQSSLKLLDQGAGMEWPLERSENGRLTEPCKEQLRVSLRGFLGIKSWGPKRRAYCALGARGVSLRRLTLPVAPREEMERLVRLQIESEFPLPPDELAWGHRELPRLNQPRITAPAGAEVLVVAVKREVLQEYSELLTACGLLPVFTLAALAAHVLCRPMLGPYAILDIGGTQSELATFDSGIAQSIRVLPWGGEDLTRAIEAPLSPSRDQAEAVKSQDFPPGPAAEATSQNALRAACQAWAKTIPSAALGRKLYLTGKTAEVPQLPSLLAQALGNIECERIGLPPGEGHSAAVLGLKQISERHEEESLLVIDVRDARQTSSATQAASGQWAALALVLALGALGLRYFDGIVRKPGLGRQLAALKVKQAALPKIDQELGFLQYLRTNQAPYVGALLAVANAAPQGTTIESVTMNRRGDLSLRGSMREANQAVDFRSRLTGSGFFATVVGEEQNPSPDRQKLVVRISAQWKPGLARESMPPPGSGKDARPPGAGPRGGPDMNPANFPPGMPPMMPSGMPPGMPPMMPSGMPPGMPPIMPSGMPPGMEPSPPSGAPPGAPPTMPPGARPSRTRVAPPS